MFNQTDMYTVTSMGNAYQMYGTMETSSTLMSSGSRLSSGDVSKVFSYETADEFLNRTMNEATASQYTIDGGIMLASARPKDDPIGQLAPVGDALLPMLACAFVYMVCKVWRKRIKLSSTEK